MKQWLIVILTAFLYIAVSLLTDGWSWTWLIWFLYGGYRLYDMIRHQD